MTDGRVQVQSVPAEECPKKSVNNKPQRFVNNKPQELAYNKPRLSYIQIMIIAIVLGVAARMIAPQFSEASNEEANISRLIDGLEAMRIQLDLYRVRHGDCFPPTDSFASFEAAITTQEGQYVPCIGEIPKNPFNGLRTVRFNGEPAGAGKAGWRLDTKTGLFQADNDVNCSVL